MRKLLIAAALAASFGAAGLGAFGAAAAQSSEGATLTLAAAGPTQLIQDGAQWRCDATACKAARVKGIPALHACKRLVAEIGAVSAFTWRGKNLDADQLAACNAAAKS